MELSVGPHIIRVISDAETDIELAERQVTGESDTDRLTIRVRSDLPRSVRDEVLLHELLHHVIALTHLQARWSDDEQEEVIRAIAPLLSMAVRVVE